MAHPHVAEVSGHVAAFAGALSVVAAGAASSVLESGTPFITIAGAATLVGLIVRVFARDRADNAVAERWEDLYDRAVAERDRALAEVAELRRENETLRVAAANRERP